MQWRPSQPSFALCQNLRPAHLETPAKQMPLKALSLLRSIKPSPNGISIEDLGLLISRQLSRLTNFSAVALYCVADKNHSLRCRYADGPLADLVDGSEMQLGRKTLRMGGRAPNANLEFGCHLDLPAELARQCGVSLGLERSPDRWGRIVGTLTLYSAAGVEIGLEQRVLMQAIAPSLATALSSSIAHDEVAAIDGTKATDREAIYSVLDALLSSRSSGPEKTHPDRMTIVRVRWHADESMQATIERAVAAAANGSGHVIRLSSDDVIVAMAQRHLAAAGLTPAPQQRTTRRTDIEVTEIVHSLQLREVLGLTSPNEVADAAQQAPYSLRLRERHGQRPVSHPILPRFRDDRRCVSLRSL